MPDLLLPPDTNRDLMVERGLMVREAPVSSIVESDRSFEAVVSTEQVAQVIDWERYEIIDEVLIARGGNFPEHVPLLPNHRRYDILDVIGSGVDFRLDGRQWLGRGIVAEPATEDDEVRKIWKRILDRHIRAVSIGYRVANFVDIPPGQSQTIVGRKFKAEARTLRISTKWHVHELSLTPIGADSMALIRSMLGNAHIPQTRRFFR